MSVATSEIRQQSTGLVHALTIVRVIRAKRERVYRAWTEPAAITRWFSPGAMTVTAVQADVRAGGRYRFVMKGAAHGVTEESYETVVSGAYKEVVPNERLRFSWQGSWNEEEELLVTVTFRDVEGGTEMTLHQERFLSADSRGKHEHGWTSSLEKLAAFVV